MYIKISVIKSANFFALAIILSLSFNNCREKTDKKNLYGFKVDTLYINKVNQLDTFRTEVYCYNYSDLPIKVVNVASSCGCTKSKILDSVIKPMDSIPLFIEYIPLQSNDTGKIIRYVTLRTNSNPAFANLILTGEVTK